MAKQGETKVVPSEERMKREITAGVARGLAPLVRALSGCPVPEFAADPWGTIREVLNDMESMQR